MQEVIYARVPAALKADVVEFANSHNIAVNAAVASLLETGLDAERASPTIEQMESELDSLKRQLSDSDRRAATLEQQRRDWDASARSILPKLEQDVATCPNCKEPVSGNDLLVLGTCPSCNKSLALAFGSADSGLSNPQFLMLIGALGLLLAFYVWQSRGP